MTGPPNFWSQFWDIKVPPKVLLFLWKIQWKVLPTNYFLANRIHNGTVSPICKWCLVLEETLDHLFFKCELASWCWDFLKIWWDWHYQLPSSFSVKALLTSNPKNVSKHIWSVIIASSLWSIWLGGNEFNFNNRKIDKDSFLDIIRLRSFRWLESLNLTSVPYRGLWDIHPLGATKLHDQDNQRIFWSHLFNRFEIICSVDASWSVSNRVGLRGWIKNSRKELLFIFSMTCRALSVFEAELHAMQFIIQIVAKRQLHGKSVVFCSDSTEVIGYISKEYIYGNLQVLLG